MYYNIVLLKKVMLNEILCIHRNALVALHEDISISVLHLEN